MNTEEKDPSEMYSSEEVIVSAAGEVTVPFRRPAVVRRRPNDSSPSTRQPIFFQLDIVYNEEEMMDEIERIEKNNPNFVGHTGNIPSFRVTLSQFSFVHVASAQADPE